MWNEPGDAESEPFGQECGDGGQEAENKTNPLGQGTEPRTGAEDSGARRRSLCPGVVFPLPGSGRRYGRPSPR